MTRASFVLAIALCACAPAPRLPSDAASDSTPADAADDRPEPTDAPELDATADVVAPLDVPSSADALEPQDVVDAARTDVTSDAGAPPDINARHGAMAVRATLRLTCGPGMPGVGAAGFCDAIKSETFEGACSVRGTRYQVAFSPFNCGLACYSITAAEDGALRTVTLSTGSGAPISGSNVVVTRGLEWVDGMGQRRQNFQVRVQLDPTPARDIRGIAGVVGVTAAPEYADVYALGCPKGP